MKLEDIEQRCNAATPGPWIKRLIMDTNTGQFSLIIMDKEWKPITWTDENAEFIAHAREDIPFLLSEVKRLKSELEQVTKENERLKKTIRIISD